MKVNKREENQYFGKYFENAICCVINNEPFFNPTEFEFTEEELTQLQNDAKVAAKYLGGKVAKWVGNETANKDCDIILDGKHLEVKRVTGGTGTYFNTSIYYFEKFGFNFKDYLNKYGIYEAIEKIGYKPNRKNNSPVAPKISSEIRHKHKDEYEKYVLPADEITRSYFQNDIINYFNNNNEAALEFFMDMLNKNSKTSKKGKPDKIIVFNYKKQDIFELDVKEFFATKTKFRYCDKSIIINNIRFSLSWQNGLGLTNPTIRVFL